MVINRDKHNLFTARPGLSVYTTGATTSPMKTSSTSGSTIVVSGGGGSGLTDELASKLNSIEEGALVNQNAYSKVAVGGNTIEAANTTDTIVITTDDKIVATLENGILKLEYKGNDDLWYKDEDGNLWTDANVYSTKEISAYGFKGGEAGSGARYLYELSDVLLTSLSSGQLLQWNGTAWVNVDKSTVGISQEQLNEQLNKKADKTAIADLLVSLESKLDKASFDSVFTINRDTFGNIVSILANANFYSIGELSAYGLEEEGDIPSGGMDVALMWKLLAGDTKEQINITHLTSALTDYASKSWVENKGYLTLHQSLDGYATEQWVLDKAYITSSALNGYATQKWVEDKGYAVATDISNTYATKVALDTLSGSVVEKSKFAEYFNSEMANWFVKDDTNKGLKPANSYGLYSETYVSAKGVNTGTGGSGGGSSYDRLDKWSDYTTDKAGWVLSALLGQDLNSRVASLESGSALSLVTTGDGNAVTAIAKSGNQLTVTKGSTFQSLITSSNKLAYSLISGTPTSLPASDVAAWAKAASKPSYAFSEITNKPTTLSGYGITDAYTSSVIDGKLSGYLPLSGGILNSGSDQVPLVLNSTGATTRVAFRKNNTTLGYLGFAEADKPLFINSSGGKLSLIHAGNYSSYALPLSGGTINGDLILDSTTNSRWLRFQTGNGAGWIGYHSDVDSWHLTNKNWSSEYVIIHSGNIGSQSVAYATSAGDSDMLGGVTHSNYMISFRSNTQDVNQSPYTAERPYILRVGSGNANLPAGMQYGNIAHFSAYGADTAFELFGAYSGQTLLYRCGETNAMFSKGWKTIAFTDSNVASATKLQTPRSIWGQSFDGTKQVVGSLISDTTKSNYEVNYSIYRACARFTASDLSEGECIEIYVGKSYSAKKVAYLGYWQGANDSTTFLRLGFHSVDNIIIANALGNVGIGTTSPIEKLHVAGNIVATGSVTAKSSSDYRLKCEFDYSVDYQERLLSLGKVCDFNYTPHAQERELAFADDKRHTSVIWQDARKANITGFCSVEEDGYGTVNPLSADLIFTMVGAIQQGIVKTERIEERVVRLEKENRELKEKINLLEGGRYGC